MHFCTFFCSGKSTSRNTSNACNHASRWRTLFERSHRQPMVQPKRRHRWCHQSNLHHHRQRRLLCYCQCWRMPFRHFQHLARDQCGHRFQRNHSSHQHFPQSRFQRSQHHDRWKQGHSDGGSAEHQRRSALHQPNPRQTSYLHRELSRRYLCVEIIQRIDFSL